MKTIILYGAGKRGRKVADLLIKKKVEIGGFCDTNKAGAKLEIGGGYLSDIFNETSC